MRTFKTSKKDRTNYNYYTATGEKIELTPNDVGSKWIALLHEDDDAAVDAERRELYHVPVHHDSLANAEGDTDSLDEKLDFMADTELNPLERIMDGITQQEHEDLLVKLREAIEELQPQQKNLYIKFFSRDAPVPASQQKKVSPRRRSATGSKRFRLHSAKK